MIDEATRTSIGIEVYACPRCGVLVGEGWLHTHMGYHDKEDT